LEKIDVDNVIEIGAYAFYQCESLRILRFSNDIKTIEGYAFQDCKNLNVSIPETCEYVKDCGDRSFKNCKNVVIREVEE
ncbi:MAG: leucine-rich repeat domain-containing protein, partial [Ruminococcus sp.]|nr:leucine-rich repeat domain-containing protein [Ruminococcus sp.]